MPVIIPGITFPDLASPPANTALGSSGASFGNLFAGDGDLVWDDAFASGFLLRIGPPESDLNPNIQGSWGDEVALITNSTLSNALTIESQFGGTSNGIGLNVFQLSTTASNGKSVGINGGVFLLGSNSIATSLSFVSQLLGTATTGNTLRGVYIANGGSPDNTTSTIAQSIGVWSASTYNLTGSLTVTSDIAFYAEDRQNTTATITNGYAFWADEQGVFRIRSDNTFNSVFQAIPALYNPQFTKYTPGATNHERVALQWESNVATLTTEKGGTGTLRALNIGDANVQVQVNGKNLTLSGNLVTTGAFNPTFAIPSSSTWTFPTGGGTLSTATGTVTSVAASVPTFLSIAGSPITSSGILAISYSGTALPVANGGTAATSASITAFNNITGYTAGGATGTTSTNLVFSTSPVLTTPNIGVASGTSLALATGGSVSSGSGIASLSAAELTIYTNGTRNFAFSGTTLYALNGNISLLSNGSSFFLGAASDVTFTRAAAATMQLGSDVNGAAVAQTFQSCRGVTGSDKTGAPFHFVAGPGTGAATVSYIDFTTPTVTTTGTTQQTGVVRATISSASLNATVPIAFGGNLAISNAVPTISSGFGAGATIAGIASGFRITCGTAPGVGGTVAFNATYANAPVCFVQDETTGILGIAAPTTTTVVISGLTLLAGQTVAVFVFGY